MIDLNKKLQKAYDEGYEARDKEIVRCKECRWGHLCVFGQHLGLDGFCSKGERKEQTDE